jgi:hypothetical protein
MMATTHALVGILMGAVALFVAPEFAPVALAAGAAGGLFPDLDLYAGHRKTLHFPVYYAVAAAGALAAALVAPTAVTVGAALFLAAAATHSLMDALGGGLELRPWEATTDEAVFSHFHGRWLRARRLVRYDGAPEDFALGAVLAVPALALTGEPFETVVLGLVAVSAVFAFLRRRLVTFGEWLFARVPAPVVERLPEDMVGDFV